MFEEKMKEQIKIDDALMVLGRGWNSPKDLPEILPHRNIRILTLDAEGKFFSYKVSSQIVHAASKLIAWKESALTTP